MSYFSDIANPSFGSAWAISIINKNINIYNAGNLGKVGGGYFEGTYALVDNPFDLLSKFGYSFGTGFRLTSSEINLITPSHTLESLYLIIEHNSIFVSNSLAFVISVAGVKLNETDFSLISTRLRSIIYGLPYYARDLLVNENYRVCRFSNCALAIDLNSMSISERHYKTAVSFADYDAYLTHLKFAIKDAITKSGSEKLICYLSSGYDSVAVASLLKSIPFENVDTYSINKSRNNEDDSGAEIAKHLGFRNFVLKRTEREKVLKEFPWGKETFEIITQNEVSNLYEWNIGFGVEDEAMKLPDNAVHNAVVFTGFHGDKIWDKFAVPTDYIKRGDTSGSSIYENRLRNRFIHIPVPMIGVLNHSEIHRITNSAEMSRFSVGGYYDRPIARRIAEECGVPRYMFGQKKKAAATMAHGETFFMDGYHSLIKRYTNLLENSVIGQG